MIDHLTLRVSDLVKAKAFYARALAPLGYEVLMELEGTVALGAGKKPDLWLAQEPHPQPMHVAFTADLHQAVEAFHVAAIAAGGRDNGKPGIRAEYAPTYYAAFVHDPDGHNIEAVCHRK